jgi:hypothetical protein
MIPKQFSSPSRWAWALPVLATAAVVACSDSLSSSVTEQTWGFVTLDAKKTASGVYQTSPQALFFKGRLAALPNASLVLDSCVDTPFDGSGNNLTGVTYLDAGALVSTAVSGRQDTLQRIATTTSITYEKNGIPFRPGDTIVVTVPGATGGYPAAEIRAKTAEAFTINDIPTPSGTEAIQLRWTAGQDLASAMILELRYTSATNVPRELLCSYADDGVDSIPFRQHQTWSIGTSSARTVVATRLRTNFKVVGDGLLEVISTFAVPTPTVP